MSQGNAREGEREREREGEMLKEKERELISILKRAYKRGAFVGK